MVPKFLIYLKKIGVTQPIQDRVEYFHCLCRDMLFGELLDIFVDDYLTEDKTRKYTGLTFCSKDYNFSVPNFLISEVINIIPHQNVQDSITITVKNFDFKKTNEESLMSVQLFSNQISGGIYRASKNNCAYLVRTLRKYIEPSLRKREIKISSGR